MSVPAEAVKVGTDAIQEEFDERGLGDASLIVTVVLDEIAAAGYEIAKPPKRSDDGRAGRERAREHGVLTDDGFVWELGCLAGGQPEGCAARSGVNREKHCGACGATVRPLPRGGAA